MQQEGTIYSSFISANCSTCFGWNLHTSSGAHITVSTVSGINETVTATCRESDWMGTGQFPSSHVRVNGNWSVRIQSRSREWELVSSHPVTFASMGTGQFPSSHFRVNGNLSVPIQSRSREWELVSSHPVTFTTGSSTVSLMPDTVDTVI